MNYVYAAIVGVFAIMAVVTSILFSKLQDAREDIGILTTQIQQQETTINNLVTQYDTILDFQTKTTKELQALTSDIHNKQVQIVEQKERIDNLSSKKPGLMENRINNATDKLFNIFETLSGKQNESETE